MKKRLLSVLLALCMVCTLLPTVAFAAATDHAIKMELVKDTTTFSGKAVLRVDFMYKGGSTDVPNNQMVYLKYDASKLAPLYATDGSDASADLEGLSDFSTDCGVNLTANNFVSTGIGKSTEVIGYSRITGGYGYLCWKVTEKGNTTIFADYTRVSSIFLGLEGDTTFNALPSNAISFSDRTEDFGITSAVNTATVTYNGSTTIFYGSAGENLLAAPTIVAGAGVTLVKPAPTCVAPTGVSATYGQTLADITLTNPGGNTPGIWTWMDSTTSVGDASATAKTFKAKFTPTDTNAFATVENIDVSVTVGAKTVSSPTIEVTPASYEYTSSAIIPTTVTVKDGETVIPAAEYTLGYTNNTNKGTATVTVTDKADGNYTLTGTLTATFAITGKAGSIVFATPGTITYDGSAVEAGNGKDLSFTYTGDGAVSVKWYAYYSGIMGSEISVPVDAGTYWIGVSAAAGTNYSAVAEKNMKFTISPKPLTETDFTMGANPDYTGSEISAPITTLLTATTDYTISGTDKLTDVAASNVTVTFNGAGNYSGSVSKTWNLTKATLTLPSAGVTAKTYDGTITATITPGALSGIKGSDAVSVLETSITGTFAGQYVGTGKTVTTTNSFTLTGAQAGNYTLTQPGALSGAITAATQTLTKVKDLQVVKGGTLTAAQLKEAVSGAQGNLTFTGAATAGSVAENVFTATAATGDVPITATAADKDLNSDSTPEYAANTTGVTFTVSVVEKQTAALTGGVTQAGCPFGQTLVNPVYTTPDGTTGTTITYAGTLRKDSSSYGPSSTKPTEAGSYTVTVKCETNTHIYSATSSTFTIAPKDIADAEVTLGAALTYTGSSQTQSVTKVELDSTDITSSCDVSGNSQTNAGEYTLTVTAKAASNYTGSTTKVFTVQKKAITPTVAITGTYTFTGSAITPTYTVKDDATDLASTDYSAATGANTNAGTNAGSLTITATANGNYSFTEVTKNFDIGKAGAQTIADQTVSQKYSVTTEQSKSVAGLMPTNAGTLTYGKGSESKTGSVTVSSWNVDTNGLVKFTLTGGATGDIVTLPVIVTSTNYADTTINVAITLTAKDAQNTLTVTNGTTVTYGQTLALTASGGSGTGAVTFEIVSGGTGAATISGSTLTPTTAGTVKVKAVKAADADYNAVASDIVEITINKANPTGTPSYTAISAANKTLEDAALAVGSITPAEGTIKWVDGSNTELPPDTAVTANTYYKWLFTPTDSDNYNTLTGSIKLYSVSTGGVSTYPVTVTAATGGTITVSPEDASRGTIVTVTIKTDEGYTLDTLSATDSSGKTVELTKKSDDAYTFMMPGSGVTVTGAFKKAEPPVNPFIDVTEPDWFYDDVMFTFVNGMMQGVSDDLFDVHGSTTRGMIVTVLYRMENEPDAVGNPFDDVENDKYYARAVAWAAANKIVNGYGPGRFGPEDHVTREQVATILYNYAVYKGYDVSVGENTNILSFKDALDIHDWAMPAMQWACGTGLIRGYDGYLTPRGNAERCQIAAIFHRFCDVVQ